MVNLYIDIFIQSFMKKKTKLKFSLILNFYDKNTNMILIDWIEWNIMTYLEL